jgi:hypothetical protein
LALRAERADPVLPEVRGCRAPVRSLLSYLGRGENSGRYLGIKIPPCGLKPDYLEQAQAFANELADRLEQVNNGKAV